MILSTAIKESYNQILSNKLDSFFLFLELVACAGQIKYFDTDTFLVLNFIIVISFNYFSHKKILKGLPGILFVLIVLFILAYFSVGANLFSFTYFGFILRVITAFFLLSYFGIRFYILFENIVFILALISLPLFIIQVINVRFFNIFSGLSNLLLIDERLTQGYGVLAGHRYFILFGVNSWAEWRNSGFAWEPAGYGAMLLLAIYANLNINNFRYNFKLLILIIATVSTFSNGTFIAGFILVLFVLYNSKISTSIIALSLIFIFSSLLYVIPFFRQKVDFMIEKTIVYNQSIESNDFKQNVGARKNRIQGTIVSLDLVKKRPLGYGLDSHSELPYIDTASGLASILFKFGFIGLFILILLLKQVFISLKDQFNLRLHGWLIFAIFFILIMIANPFSNQPFFLSFVLSGYIMDKNKKQILSEK